MWYIFMSIKVQDSQFVEQRNIFEELMALANGFIINGFRFQTKNLEKKRKTQNSGVFVIAKTTSFSSANDSNPTVRDITYYGI